METGDHVYQQTHSVQRHWDCSYAEKRKTLTELALFHLIYKKIVILKPN